MDLKSVMDILENAIKDERYRIHHQWKGGDMGILSQEEKNTDNVLFSLLNIIENIKMVIQ